MDEHTRKDGAQVGVGAVLQPDGQLEPARSDLGPRPIHLGALSDLM